MFIAGVVVGFVVGFVILGVIALLSHKHEWEARNLTYMTRSATVEDEVINKCDVTEVLYGCSCGEVKTKQLVGTWKMADITGPSPKAKGDTELESLRKMAGIPSEEGK